MKNFLVTIFYDNGFAEQTISGKDLNKAYFEFCKREAKRLVYPIGFKLIKTEFSNNKNQ